MHEEALEGRVRFLGKVSEGTLKYLYQHALAFTFPSAFEGFGMPVVEAMMEGTPVLTSNVSSLPEAAGGAALLVDPFDPTAIGEGLLELVQNESLRQELRAKGFMSAERFSWEKSAKTLTKVLSAL
jgi:glycosyltransferase involved in cell wall biosynthesis